MYSLVSLEKIIAFFQKYNIDIEFMPDSQQALIIILSNIFVIIFYWFILHITYKIILKLLDWWF